MAFTPTGYDDLCFNLHLLLDGTLRRGYQHFVMLLRGVQFDMRYGPQEGGNRLLYSMLIFYVQAQVVQDAERERENRPVSAEAQEQVAEKEVVEGLLSKAFQAHQLATRSVSLVNLLDQPAVHVSGDTTVGLILHAELPSIHSLTCVKGHYL